VKSVTCILNDYVYKVAASKKNVDDVAEPNEDDDRSTAPPEATFNYNVCLQGWLAMYLFTSESDVLLKAFIDGHGGSLLTEEVNHVAQTNWALRNAVGENTGCGGGG
jgi:hypothetical protein